MRIVREIDRVERDALIQKHQSMGHRAEILQSHFVDVINMSHLFELEIDAQSYDDITVYAGGGYDPIKLVMGCVAQSSDCFAGEWCCGLKAKHLQYHLNVFNSCEGVLRECFLNSGDLFMLDKGVHALGSQYEVTDGQHRLVAYGLVTKLQSEHFPIMAYWGTDKDAL